MNKPVLFVARNCQVSRRPCKTDLQKKKKKETPPPAMLLTVKSIQQVI